MRQVAENKSFNIYSRKKIIDQIKNSELDLIVIGGGVTGCGIALDAASRGMSVALFEKADFASGTSSKSTKLIHGGLRYLKQLDVQLVRETGRERAIVNKIAPHLALPEKMLLPIIEKGTYGKFAASLGLWVYDFLANVKGKDQRRMLSKNKALEKEPLLNDKILKGAGYYAEYRTDDARLTIELIKKAFEKGAYALNYAEVLAFDGNKRITGVQVQDRLSGETYTFNSKYIVSAAGPWVDTIRKIDHSLKGKRLHLTKGIHLVVKREKLPLKQSVYFDVPDGRMIFTIPRGNVSYIGTTDTNYTGALDRVICTAEDRKYLLDSVNAAFPSIQLSEEDVESNWAGLRPLIHEEGKSPSELSRKDEIFESETGLISIAGGKLTGYRKMAEKIVDLICKKGKDRIKIKYKKTSTHKIALTSDPFKSNAEVTKWIEKCKAKLKGLKVENHYAWYLVTTYGKIAADLIQKVIEDKEYPTELEFIFSELDYGIMHEMVCTSADFWVRRTGRLYFNISSVKKYREQINAYLAERYNWNESERKNDLDELQNLIEDAETYYIEETLA